MQWLSSLWRSEPPATVASDNIVPLHILDACWMYQRFLVAPVLRFDEALDSSKLTDALLKLIQTGDYRKLGARTRRNQAGKLEYHIPAAFDEQRPAFRYSHVNLSGTPIAEHPLASRMPRVTDAPVRQNTADEFIEFCLDPEAPKTAADYFNKDEPLLSLRIISFQDATIICVLWPHFQWDIVGFGGFMEAWAAVLNGQSPPRMIGFAEDPLDALDTVNVDIPPIAAALDLTGLGKLKFIASVVWEAMAQGKVLQQHFCLPSAMIKHFKGKAMEEIKRRDGLDAYVSEGDVAAALTLKATAAGISATRPIYWQTAWGLRKQFPELFPPGTFHMSMAVLGSHLLLPAAQVQQSTITELAILVRQNYQKTSTKGELSKDVRMVRDSLRQTGDIPLRAAPYAKMGVYTNWSAASLMACDCSAARLRKDTTGPLVPSSILSVGRSSLPTAGANVITGRDAHGNTFLQASLAQSRLPGYEETLMDAYRQMLAEQGKA